MVDPTALGAILKNIEPKNSIVILDEDNVSNLSESGASQSLTSADIIGAFKDMNFVSFHSHTCQR